MSYILSRLNRAHVPLRYHRIVVPYNGSRGYADFKQLKQTAMKAVKSATQSVQSLTKKVTSSGKVPLDLNKIKKSAKTAMGTVSKSLQSLTQKGGSSGKGGKAPIDLNKIKQSASKAAGTVSKYLQPLTQKVTTSGRLDLNKIKTSAMEVGGSISKSLQSLAQKVGIPKEKLDSIGSKLNQLAERTKPALQKATKIVKKNAKSLKKKVLETAKKSGKRSSTKPKAEKFASSRPLLVNPTYAYGANLKLITIISKIWSVEGNNNIHQKIRVFSYVMNLAFYRHFVVGEDKDKNRSVLQKLQPFGSNDMMDHGIKDNLPLSTVEKQALSLRKTTTQHTNVLQFSENIADGQYELNMVLIYFSINSKLRTHIYCYNQPGLVTQTVFF